MEIGIRSVDLKLELNRAGLPDGLISFPCLLSFI